MSTLWLTDGRPSISARDGGEGGKRQDFESKKIFCPPPDPSPPPPHHHRAAPAAADERDAAGTPTPTIIAVAVSDRLVNRRSDKLNILSRDGRSDMRKEPFSQKSPKTCHKSTTYQIFRAMTILLLSWTGENKEKSHCGRKVIPPPSLPVPSRSPRSLCFSALLRSLRRGRDISFSVVEINIYSAVTHSGPPSLS